MVTITNIKEAAIACWRLEKWINSVKTDRKIAAQNSIKKLKDFLVENRVEVIDLTGEEYNPGLSVEIMVYEDEEDGGEKKTTIVEMIKPIIIQDGRVVNFGQVVIANEPGVSERASEPVSEPVSEQDPEAVRESALCKVSKMDLPKEQTIDYKKMKMGSVLSVLIAVIILFFLFLPLKNQLETIETEISQIVNNQSRVETRLYELIEGTIQTQNNKNDEGLIRIGSTSWKVHLVEPGDTLYSICKAHDVNYNYWERQLLSTNGMKDADKIYAGQALLIPVPVEGEQQNDNFL